MATWPRAEAGVGGRHVPVPEHHEAAFAQGVGAPGGQERVDEDAAGERDLADLLELAGTRGDVDHETDDGPVEADGDEVWGRPPL